MLQDGHAVYILVEPVEKATDKRSASLLCCRVADAGSSETISPSLARRTSPHPPPCAWAGAYFDSAPLLCAEARQRDRFVTGKSSPLKRLANASASSGLAKQNTTKSLSSRRREYVSGVTVGGLTHALSRVLHEDTI